MPGRFARIDDPNRRVLPAQWVETHPAIDVHTLQRQGALVEGASVTLQLADGGCLRVTRTGGNINLGGQLIPIGWHRALPLAMFGCPRCNADRYRLYLVGGVWACRDCHHLDWQSRHIHRSRSIVALHRIRWLRARLNANPTPFTPLPAKPPRWRRHWRLAREIRALEETMIEHARRDVTEVLTKRYANRS